MSATEKKATKKDPTKKAPVKKKKPVAKSVNKKAVAKKVTAKKPSVIKAASKTPVKKKVARKAKTTQKKASTKPALSPTSIMCYSPSNGDFLGEVKVDTPEQVKNIVARARAAQIQWQKTSFRKRRAVLKTLSNYILDHADELCRDVVLDSGKTLENAMMGEIWPVCEKLRWTINEGTQYLQPEIVSSGLFWHKRAKIEYVPKGVIGVIAPWNYPLQNILGPVIHTLFSGNATVVKISEAVAWSSQRFQKIFDEVFDKHGVSRDLVCLINGYPETGKALIDANVDQIIFTGSMPNGKKVMEACADNLTPLVLELGGKDPMIVCADAPLSQAVHNALNGVYIACGQNCLAAERILVFEKIYDRFVAKIDSLVGQLKQGDPTGPELVDTGALVSENQLHIIDSLVKDAVKQGAKVLHGGKIAPGLKGNFYEPTVLIDVTPTMRIMQEEAFGPIMLIVKVTDEEGAITLANDIPYGLSSSVMTRSKRRASRIAKRLNAGSTVINDFALTYMIPDLPFGGIKGSGFGRLNGKEGLRDLTHKKAVIEDWFPLRFPSKLYPVHPKDYMIYRSIMRLLYRKGFLHKLKAFIELTKSGIQKIKPSK